MTQYYLLKRLFSNALYWYSCYKPNDHLCAGLFYTITPIIFLSRTCSFFITLRTQQQIWEEFSKVPGQILSKLGKLKETQWPPYMVGCNVRIGLDPEEEEMAAGNFVEGELSTWHNNIKVILISLLCGISLWFYKMLALVVLNEYTEISLLCFLTSWCVQNKNEQ